jgi:hypothetical protein
MDAAKAYLGAKDGDQLEVAYRMLAPGNQALQTQEQYSSEQKALYQRSGPVEERRYVKVTWTKDPAQAPGPGIYVAMDLVTRFARAQRSCGYLVLFQPPGGGPFKIAREETNTFFDDDAAEIEKRQSRAAVDSAWAKLAANCPNYPVAEAAASPPPAPIAESSTNEIGYPTVAAALAALRGRKDVQISTQAGWTIISDDATSTLWSFAPEGNPAYPAAVKRHIYQTNQGVMLDMRVHCEASKAACDDLVRSFEALNAQMSAALKSGSEKH